jgi:sortase A
MPSHVKENLLKGIGIGLIIFSGFILYRLFNDPIKQEVGYQLRQNRTEENALVPPNTDFALIIPKIGASSSIIQDVSPYNSQEYQLALRDGVAHAEGTKLPGEGGNIFLFAHSSADLLTAERYNSIFYLMHHLENGDEIKVWYKNNEYRYTIAEKHLVAPTDTKYLTAQSNSETLTLMTCWPPGTTYKRLIIVAKPAQTL